MPRAFNIVRYVLTTTGWTDIVIPLNCSIVHLLNQDEANTQLVRSDKGDSLTEMWLLPNATLKLESPVEAFQHGTVICSIKSQSGTGPIVAQFIR